MKQLTDRDGAITGLRMLDVRFPTSRERDGSDAMNVDPDYSAAYVIVETDRGDGLELDVIAAVIMGGGSLAGGRGTVLGTLLGATTMAVIQIGCAQKGYPNWVQQIVTGGIIVLAVALDRWRQGRAS